MLLSHNGIGAKKVHVPYGKAFYFLIHFTVKTKIIYQLIRNGRTKDKNNFDRA